MSTQNFTPNAEEGGGLLALTEEESIKLAAEKRAMVALAERDENFKAGMGDLITNINQACRTDIQRTGQEKTDADSQYNIFLQGAKNFGTFTQTIGGAVNLIGVPGVTEAANVGTAITTISLASIGGIFKLVETLLRSAKTYKVLTRQRTRIEKELQKERNQSIRDGIKVLIESANELDFLTVNEIKAKNEIIKNMILQKKHHVHIMKKIENIRTLMSASLESEASRKEGSTYAEYKKFLVINGKALDEIDILINEAKELFPNVKDFKIPNRNRFTTFQELSTSLKQIEDKTDQSINEGKGKLMKEIKSKAEILLVGLNSILNETEKKDKAEVVKAFLKSNQAEFMALFNFEKQLKGNILFSPDLLFIIRSGNLSKQKGTDQTLATRDMKEDAKGVSERLLAMDYSQLKNFVAEQEVEKNRKRREETIALEEWAEQSWQELQNLLEKDEKSVNTRLERLIAKMAKEESIPHSLEKLELELASSIQALQVAEQNISENRQFVEVTTNSVVEKISKTYALTPGEHLDDLTQWMGKWIFPAVQIFIHGAERGFTTMASSLSTTPGSNIGFSSDYNTRVSNVSMTSGAFAQSKDGAVGAEAVSLALKQVISSNPDSEPAEILKMLKDAMSMNAQSGTNSYAIGVKTALAVIEKSIIMVGAEASQSDIKNSMVLAAAQALNAAQEVVNLKSAAATVADAGFQSIRSQFTVSQLQLAITTVRDIGSTIPDIKDFVNNLARGMLKQSATDKGVQLLDLIFTLDACARDPAFQMTADSIKIKMQNALENMMGQSPKLKEVMEKLDRDNALRNAMTSILETNVENFRGALQIDNHLWLNKDQKTPKKPEEVIEGIVNQLKTLENNLISINDQLEMGQVNAIEVWFPAFSNVNKERFMLVANKQEDVVFFNNVAAAKKSILEMHKAFNQLPATALIEKEAQDGVVSEFLKPGLSELNNKLTKLESKIKTLEETVAKQIKKLNDEEIYNDRRTPYVNIFLDSSNPLNNIQNTLRTAKFSDLISILSVSNLRALAKFVVNDGAKGPLIDEFIRLYGPSKVMMLPEESDKLEVAKLDFIKKISTPPEIPIEPLDRSGEQMLEYRKALLEYKTANKKYQGELQVLQNMWTDFCSLGAWKGNVPWTFTDFKKSHTVGENENLNFTSDEDLKKFLQQNEQHYHSQRVLGIQKSAILESMRKDYREALNLINTKLGRPEMKGAEELRKAAEEEAKKAAEEAKKDETVTIHIIRQGGTKNGKAVPPPPSQPSPLKLFSYDSKGSEATYASSDKESPVPPSPELSPQNKPNPVKKD